MKVAPFVGDVSAKVTLLVSDEIVFPPASCTVTTGANIAPATDEAGGCVVNASAAAEDGVMAKLLLLAAVRPGEVA